MSAVACAAFGVVGILAFAAFRAQIVAVALEITPAAASHVLGELVDYGLLLRPDDSYQVTHALAHSYALTQAAPGAEVINRLAIYYVAWAKAKGANGRLAGYAVLDRHRAHIMAVQFAALSARQWDAVQKITASLSDYPDAKGYWTERITLVQAGLDAARASMDRHDECAFLRELGVAYYRLGEPHRAIELYEQHLPIAREIGDRGGEGNTLVQKQATYSVIVR